MAGIEAATEFVYVDTAIGGVNRRNRVRRLSEVDYSPGSERYISHRRATTALVDWVNSHQNSSGQPTVEGFDGPTWDSSLPFDFDDRTDPAHALEWTRQFLDKLGREDVPLDALRLYFSGYKGFHLEIPHTLFGGFVPSETLHASEKLAAASLLGGIPYDGAVYDKLRLWRLPNTINAKSGKYKVRLSLSEVRGLSIAEIQGLAESPRPRLVNAPDDEWVPNEYLVEVWAQALGLEPAVPVTTAAPMWSDDRQNQVIYSMLVAAIANSWPTDPTLSRHSDYLLPLSGFLARYMDAVTVAAVLESAAEQSGDREFFEDRTRHWQQEIERMAQSSVVKIAAGARVEGLPTIAKHWPELADLLGALFVVRVATPSGTQSKTERPSGFKFSAAEDLLAEPPEETAFLVDGMLPSGGFSLWGGKPKSGKSVGVRNLALAVARGEPFLDRACHQGVVLVLCLEEKRAEVANHFRKMGVTTEPLHIHTGAAPGTSKEGLAALENAITMYQPVLVIVDPVFKLIRVKDSSDYAELTRELEPVIELARNTGCHVAVAHHLGKQIREGGDDVLGSTAIFGAVDTLVLIRRRKDNLRVFQTIQRYGTDLAETVVPMDDDSGLIRLGGSVVELKASEVRQAVLELLGKIGEGEEGFTRPQIRAELEQRAELVGKVITELLAEGEIEQTGQGIKGDPFRYKCHSAIPGIYVGMAEQHFGISEAVPEQQEQKEQQEQGEQREHREQNSLLDAVPVMCRRCGKELWPDEEAAGVHETCP